MQTLPAGCSQVEPKDFTPPQDVRGAGWPKLNHLEMVTTFTYRPAQLGEDRCTQFPVIVVTDPHTHTHTHTSTNIPTDMTDYKYTVPQLASVQWNYSAEA